MTSPSSAPVATSAARYRRGFSPYLWVWIGVALLLGLMLIVTPNQASFGALGNTLPYVGLLALVSVGQALVVMQRGIDFSIVGALILSGMVSGVLSTSGLPIWVAVLGTMAAGLFIGLVNGVVVVFLRLTPLVATLASNLLYLGLAIMVGQGAPVHTSSAMIEFARSKPLAISAILIVAIIVVAALVVFVNRTVLGGRFIASGSNPLSARAAGIPVNGYVLSAYCLAGLLYGVAGMLLTGHIGDARMTMGGDYLMASIAAVVVGGTPLTGGRGSLIATVGGAVFMTLLTQFVLALGSPSSVQLLVQSIVLIAAITLPSLVALLRKRRKTRAAAAAPPPAPPSTLAVAATGGAA